MKNKIMPSPETLDLLRKSGSSNKAEAMVAQQALAAGLGEVVRKGILDGDTLGNIFDRVPLSQGVEAKFPLDFVAPGTEDRFTAFDLPAQGRVPERHVEGDEILVRTFDVGNAIDYSLSYARDARFDVVARAMNVLRDGHTAKNNIDGWTVLLACAGDRGIVANDSSATSGVFTKELAAKMKTSYLRNVGGNASTGGLTDMYVSLEAIEDMRAFGVADVDDFTRRQLLVGGDETPIPGLYGMTIHALTELGVGERYQTIYTALGGSLTAGDEELVIGLDLMVRDSFVNPVREDLQIFPADDLHRQRRQGFYSWLTHGYACIDNRRTLAASF